MKEEYEGVQIDKGPHYRADPTGKPVPRMTAVPVVVSSKISGHTANHANMIVFVFDCSADDRSIEL